jgi:predicted MPP superfamily phosphohydrolase
MPAATQTRSGDHRLRILHLSDLHLRGPRETERERRNRVLGASWFANLVELRSDGAFDLVAFTGDIAFAGALDEYLELVRRVRDDGTAATWLDDTLAAIGCSRTQLYVVPGNHDIDRGRHPGAWRTVREAWSAAGPDDDAALARWIVRDRGAPRGIGPELRAQVLDRQSAYRTWLAHGLGRSDLVPDPSRSQLGYRVAASIDRLPFPVHIIGLDSAWLAGDDHDARNLRLTDDQILRLCTRSDGEPLDGLRLALIHHPLADLADGERSRRLLQEYGVDLLLSGHLHDPDAREISTPDGQLRDLATGCLYQHDRYRNAVTALTLDLDGAGRVRGIELRCRSWSERGHWHDDNSLYRGTRNGRLVWSTRPPRPPAATPPRPPATTPPRPRHVILFLAADPAGMSRHAVDEECAAIERELDMAPGRDEFEFRSKWAVSVDELLRHLNELQPAIIHFSGQFSGAVGTGFDLVDDRSRLRSSSASAGSPGSLREPQHVSPHALAELIRSAAPSTRLVVLNACFDDRLADALCAAVDCTIGLRGGVGDDAARSFAMGFYRGLGYRRSVGVAFAQAAAALAAKQLADDDAAVCRTRRGVSADQISLPRLDPAR